MVQSLSFFIFGTLYVYSYFPCAQNTEFKPVKNSKNVLFFHALYGDSLEICKVIGIPLEHPILPTIQHHSFSYTYPSYDCIIVHYKLLP